MYTGQKTDLNKIVARARMKRDRFAKQHVDSLADFLDRIAQASIQQQAERAARHEREAHGAQPN